jgi:hypothetical protein
VLTKNDTESCHHLQVQGLGLLTCCDLQVGRIDIPISSVVDLTSSFRMVIKNL